MNLIKYLPFENYILTTNLRTDEVCKRLSENIEPKNLSIFSSPNRNSTKQYEGNISGNIFQISRIISYRNSFLPIIKGNISSSYGQTQIKIKMHLVTFVLIFISLWLGVVGLVCIGILLAGILQLRLILANGFSPMLLIPLGMFIFGCALTIIPFKIESKKSKEFLTNLLDGQENDNFIQK